MKASAEGINGSNVMEKCQCLASQVGIRMPLQHHLLLFPQPQMMAAAGFAGAGAHQCLFPVLLVWGRRQHHSLGKVKANGSIIYFVNCGDAVKPFSVTQA